MTTDQLPPVFQPLQADDPREVGGYRLYARLGAGGMGRVYLAYTPGGRPVAIKVVRPEFAGDGEFRRRFAHEVGSARRIHGLYTAQVIDSGLDEAAPWLVTAYVPGPSLQQVVRGYGPLPVRTVLLLAGGIAEALQAIHAVEVVHRDLKPANVLIAGDGPRVIDFGIARAADSTVLTGTGIRIGSPAFMAPEQALGHPVSPAADVWALGALTAYIAGGALPFGQGPDTAVLYRVVHEQPDLTGVPEALHGLLLACLAKRPEDRPTPAAVIEAARAHPAVGGQLRFADDWLPAQLATELTRRSDLPRTPPPPSAPPPSVPPPSSAPPSPAVLPAAPPSVPPVPATAPGTVLSAPPAPGFGPPLYDTVPPQAPRRRSGRGRALVAVSLVTAVAATVTGILLAQSGEDGGYTVVYRDHVLAAPDYSYSIDLTAGVVVRDSDNPSWALEPTYGHFNWSSGSDAFIAKGKDLTAAQCAAGIGQSPVTELKYDQLPAGAVFCLRSAANGSVAVVRVVEPGRESAVKVSVTTYRVAG